MKTYEEKAVEIIEQLMCCDFRTQSGIDKAKSIVRRSLRKQDRDTRHACAITVFQCERDISNECIWVTEAYNAVTNCNGGG